MLDLAILYDILNFLLSIYSLNMHVATIKSEYKGKTYRSHLDWKTCLEKEFKPPTLGNISNLPVEQAASTYKSQSCMEQAIRYMKTAIQLLPFHWRIERGRVDEFYFVEWYMRTILLPHLYQKLSLEHIARKRKGSRRWYGGFTTTKARWTTLLPYAAAPCSCESRSRVQSFDQVDRVVELGLSTPQCVVRRVPYCPNNIPFYQQSALTWLWKLRFNFECLVLLLSVSLYRNR